MRERVAEYRAWVDARMIDAACAASLIEEDAGRLSCDCSALVEELGRGTKAAAARPVLR